jgi:hypothetical protein
MFPSNSLPPRWLIRIQRSECRQASFTSSSLHKDGNLKDCGEICDAMDPHRFASHEVITSRSVDGVGKARMQNDRFTRKLQEDRENEKNS